MFGTVGAIAVLVLTPILWILSHKYFRFIYFGNIGNAILKEILECFFISLFLVCALGGILKVFFQKIGAILLIALKITVIVAGIATAIWIISRVIKRLKGNGTSSNTSTPVDAAENRVFQEEKESIPDNTQSANPVGTAQDSDDSNDEETVLNSIMSNYKKEDYISATRYYREKTGADFNAAKIAVDSIFNKNGRM